MVTLGESGTEIGYILLSHHVGDFLHPQSGILQKLAGPGKPVIRYVFQNGLPGSLLKNGTDVVDGKMYFIRNGIDRHGFSVVFLDIFLYLTYHIGVFSSRFFLMRDQNLMKGAEKQGLQLADTAAAFQLAAGKRKAAGTSGGNSAFQKREHSEDGVFEGFTRQPHLLYTRKKTVGFFFCFRLPFIREELLQMFEFLLKNGIRQITGNVGGGKNDREEFPASMADSGRRISLREPAFR